MRAPGGGSRVPAEKMRSMRDVVRNREGRKNEPPAPASCAAEWSELADDTELERLRSRETRSGLSAGSFSWWSRDM